MRKQKNAKSVAVLDPAIDDGGSNIDVEEAIRRRAYELSQQRDGHGGDPCDDWCRAEQEVRGARAINAA
jgi:hypothetical protein